MKNILLSYFLIIFNLFFIFSSLEAAKSYKDEDKIINEIFTKQNLTRVEAQELVVRYLFLWFDENKAPLSMKNLKEERIKKKSISFYDVYRIYFNDPEELIRKMMELDTKEKYTKYILISKIPEEIYKDQKLREILQNSFIKDFLFPWMDKNKRFLNSVQGLDTESIRFSPTKIYGSTTFVGLFEGEVNLIERVVELDKKEKYMKYILQANLGDTLYENDEFLEKLTKSFIKEYLFPWMDKNKKFPRVKEFSLSIKPSLGISLYKLSKILKTDNLHDGYINLIRTVLKYDETEKYTKYLVEYDFSKECYADQYIMDKVKKSFIKDFLIPWIDRNQRWPEITDFYDEKNGIGVVYYKIFGYPSIRLGVFDSLESLIEKMIELGVEDRYLKYILKIDISPSLYFNETVRNRLQTVFIKEFLLPWVDTTTEFSSLEQDFSVSNMGFSRYKIFGYKKGDTRLFDSFSDFIKKVIQIDNEEKYLKHLLKIGIPQEIYEDDEIRSQLDKVFVKEYVFPWFDKNKDLPISEIDFHISSIEYPRHKILTNKSSSTLGLFYSYKDLITNIIKVDKEEKYIKYILNLYITQECYNDDNLRKSLQYIFVTKYLFPWLDKYKRFPMVEEYSKDNEDMDISYNRVFSKNNMLGIFGSYKDLVIEIIKLDKEEKYLKYLLNSVIPQNLYKDENIRKILQKTFIKEYICHWISEHGKFPMRYDLKDIDPVIYNKLFNINGISRLGIFDNMSQLKDEYISYIKEINDTSSINIDIKINPCGDLFSNQE